MHRRTVIDVAIIGCGPTGALLGNLLGCRGMRVAIFEKQREVFTLPRAVHFDGEAMRLFQSVGLADALVRATRVNPGMLFKDAGGTTLVDWSRDPKIGPMGWHESYRFNQPDLERHLRVGLGRFRTVTLRTGVAVHDVSQDADGVSVVWEDGGTRARYVVACDGAESTIRRVIGAKPEDLGFQERWLVVDLVLRRERADLGDYSIQFCDADAPSTYVRGVGDRRRWEFRISDADPDEFDAAQIWARLARWITPDDADLERHAVYTFRSRVADHWRSGRVFLAGDAAHQMPPFMGQGMGAGLRDVANLAWKISAVCNGADPFLLDSYQSEREPNARAFIDLSVDLGRLINQTAAGSGPAGQMRSIWPKLGPGVGASGAGVGTLVPQVDRADDRAPNGFYALVRAVAGTELPDVIGGLDWLDTHDIFGAIVRPDGYALASGQDAAEFNSEVERFLPLISTVPDRNFDA